MNLNFHENHRLLFTVVLFGFIFLTVIIAISPALWVQNHTYPLPGSKALSDREAKGLAIYIAEGCPYCHTQQVRPLSVDKPFGRPSAPGDYARLGLQDTWRMTPALLGTERTGPDLSNLAGRQPSDIWNYIHLYNPRAVVKDSVMQAYPWLFAVKTGPAPDDIVIPVPRDYAPKQGKVIAAQQAKDLVAYLLSLKQIPIPGGAASGAREPTTTAPRAASVEGGAIYSLHCASCHGPNGEGVPGVFPPMKDDPVVTDKDPARHIRIVLYGLAGETISGVRYTASMPAHANELSDTQIAAVINHERSSWGNSAPTITSPDVARIRKQGKP
jgi:cytochrome c oxidase cbb3-type subunit II